jgi:hypothetical protein
MMNPRTCSQKTLTSPKEPADQAGATMKCDYTDRGCADCFARDGISRYNTFSVLSALVVLLLVFTRKMTG